MARSNSRLVRVEPDRLAVIAQRVLDIIVALVRDPAIVMERGEIVAGELSALDQARAGGDDGCGLGRAGAILLVAAPNRANDPDSRLYGLLVSHDVAAQVVID